MWKYDPTICIGSLFKKTNSDLNHVPPNEFMRSTIYFLAEATWTIAIQWQNWRLFITPHTNPSSIVDKMCFRWWYLSLSHVVKCCIAASETFCLLTFYLISRNLWTLKMIITNVQHLAFVCTRLTAKGGEAAPLVFLLRRTLRHHSKTTTKHYTYYIQ